MNKLITILILFSFGISVNPLFAQIAEEKPSKFSFIGYGGIGVGIVDNDKEPNYNVNTNNATFLLNYKFMKGLGVATGIGFNTLNGNGFNSVGNFYHERALLQIPLYLSADADISDHLRFLMNFGVYTNCIVKDEFRYISYVEKNVYDGWSYGMQLAFGFFFNLSEDYSIGLNYSGQSDFGKIESDVSKGISDKQKLRYLNSIGISFIIDF